VQQQKKGLVVMIGIPAGLITMCVLIVAIGMVGIAISGILWVLTQIAEESKND
jgi:hypothetical protein